jgi:hypothetical protein
MGVTVTLTLFLQAVLLVTTFDVLIFGSEVTCWIWLSIAAIQTLFLWLSYTATVVKHARQWDVSSPGVLLVGLAVVAWASYCATGLMRNAVTEYHGSPDPGGPLERTQYDSPIKVMVTLEGRSPGDKEQPAEAMARVVNHGFFWERFKSLHIKSVSFAKGRPQRIQSQDDELWPHEDATATYVTTEHGATVWLALTKKEIGRFRK